MGIDDSAGRIVQLDMPVSMIFSLESEMNIKLLVESNLLKQCTPLITNEADELLSIFLRIKRFLQFRHIVFLEGLYAQVVRALKQIE